MYSVLVESALQVLAEVGRDQESVNSCGLKWDCRFRMDREQTCLCGDSARNVSRDKFAEFAAVKWVWVLFNVNVLVTLEGVNTTVAIMLLPHCEVRRHERIAGPFE